MQKLDAEHVLKNGKDKNLKSNLEKISAEKFVLVLAGATDIYRREQILSQQCQKIDQFGFEVYDNIKTQLDKLQQMQSQISSVLKKCDGRNCILLDFKVLDAHLFSNLQAAVTDILTTGKFRNEPFAKSFSYWKVTKEEAPKKALEDLLEYIEKLTSSLESRFKKEFNSDFIKEMKNVFDFNFMIGLVNDGDVTHKKMVVMEHGVDSLKKLIKRESPKDYSYERKAEIIKQYNAFKQFSIMLLEPSNELDVDQLNIKNNALVESAICNKCHQRINMKAIQKHVERRHRNEDTEFSDSIGTYSSMKLLHGVCHFNKYNLDKKEFLALALKIAVKTPNESIVESIGSMLNLHSRHNRPCNQTTYHNKLMIDWNGPTITKADNIIKQALDLHFSGRKKWRFKVTSSKFALS